MAKAIVYVALWGIMVATTIVQVIIFATSSPLYVRQLSVILLAIAEAVTAAAYFQNLRYETRVLSMLPITALVVLSTLLVTSVLSMGG